MEKETVPHQPVGQTVRIQSGEHGDGGQRAGGDLQGEDQQRDDGGSVPTEKEGHHQQISRLSKDADREQQQHQARHTGQYGSDEHQ